MEQANPRDHRTAHLMTYRQITASNKAEFFYPTHLRGDPPADEVSEPEMMNLPQDELADQTGSRGLYLFGLGAVFARIGGNDEA